VLTITAPHLPFVEPFIPVVNPGKRSAYLDLNQPEQADRLRELAAEADVFAQGYRGGALERRGFGLEELVGRRPGLIYVSVNCYGPVGPWRDRPGWEQLGQSATGIAVGHGGPERPIRLTAQACDYTTGYLAALGTLIALGRRAREGGSYHVRASLCQTGMWIAAAGKRFGPEEGQGLGDIDDLRITTETPFGTLRHLAPVLELSETPPHWARPPVPLGSDSAGWSS
jgi:crotonobetainyl-CoA:carnitine CoA-transferase CaiB-like acyl-CoA transferase